MCINVGRGEWGAAGRGARLSSNDLSGGFEAVTYPRLGDDVTRRRRFRLQLLAELADKHPQVLHLFGALTAPDRSQQGSVRRHLTGAARQIGEQIKFLGSKVN